MKEKWRLELELRREKLEMSEKEYQEKERTAEQEAVLRKRELDLREREQQARERKDQKMLEILTQQQHQQKVFLLQMQHGNQALLSCIANLQEKIK